MNPTLSRSGVRLAPPALVDEPDASIPPRLKTSGMALTKTVALPARIHDRPQGKVSELSLSTAEIWTATMPSVEPQEWISTAP